MIGFTKERIEQFIKNPLEHGLTRSEQMEMARQLLAGMGQEPVGITDRSEIEGLKRGEMANVMPPDFKGVDAGDEVLLYAAPQLPQPAMTITQHFDTIALDTAKMVMCDVNRRHEFLGGDVQLLSRIQCRIDEACRAAMLQGAEPVSQPYTLRDGWVAVPADMTPEQMRSVQLNSELGAYAAANLSGAYSLFREFWDVAIAAAPQQEVKP